MASCSEIERFLSILGTGMAGLRLLKEYGLRTPELEYFLENVGDKAIKISAFAPSPLKDRYEPLLAQAEKKLKSGLEKLSGTSTDVSAETINEVLNDAGSLYVLLNDMHRAALSGAILA